ncbi:OmpA family protein [Mangrovicoccus algicola]|uniref:OmpA family protein n=1 Tax=Mangrovicoccus algicola TaxID=2771008 RepID=A0A8J6Z3P9_9RHOB|nr:OmpA family protein [Mangrovicoccus algicola]MBE3636909.1 OmpA family protein [Mangrovicoccus algicola]
MIRATAILLSGATLLAGCAGINTPENQNRNTGAIGGAAAGAIIGAATGGDGRAIAMGTALGGIVGAGVGEMLDRQAADLRAQMGNDQVTVTNTGDSLLVNFPQDILFATDSASVSSASRDELAGLARNLQNYPGTTVQIIGHTDNTGDAGYNFDLSNRRAGAVAGVLVQNGVTGGRITSSGRGEDQPVASNLTPEGRAQNRRVEVVITPAA